MEPNMKTSIVEVAVFPAHAITARQGTRAHVHVFRSPAGLRRYHVRLASHIRLQETLRRLTRKRGRILPLVWPEPAYAWYAWL